MARQFEIYPNPNKALRTTRPFVIVLQADVLRTLRSRVVAPLRETAPRLSGERLNPEVEVSGKKYAIILTEMAAISCPPAGLGKIAASVPEIREKVVQAIDLIFTGI